MAGDIIRFVGIAAFFDDKIGRSFASPVVTGSLFPRICSTLQTVKKLPEFQFIQFDAVGNHHKQYYLARHLAKDKLEISP